MLNASIHDLNCGGSGSLKKEKLNLKYLKCHASSHMFVR